MSRNSDADKRPIALWMARTRKDLGATVEAIAPEAGYSVSALRKVEGGSNPKPSRALVNAVFRVFRRLGAEKGIAVTEPPGTNETATPEGMAVLVATIDAAIERQTQAILAAIRARDTSIEGLLQELASYREQQQGLVETVVAALEQRGSAAPKGGRGPELHADVESRARLG